MVLDTYPAAAAEKDFKGCLPLHIAVECGSCVEVVDMLLKAHADAARERNTDQEFPLFALIIAGQAAGVRRQG
jgi:ankyrin repeat protein